MTDPRKYVTAVNRPQDVLPGDKVTLEWHDAARHKATTEGVAYREDGKVKVGSIDMALVGKPTGNYAHIKMLKVERQIDVRRGSTGVATFTDNRGTVVTRIVFFVEPRRGTPYWIDEIGDIHTGEHFRSFAAGLVREDEDDDGDLDFYLDDWGK